MTKRLRMRDITEVAIARLRGPAIVVARGKAIAVLIPVLDDARAERLVDVFSGATLETIRVESQHTDE